MLNKKKRQQLYQFLSSDNSPANTLDSTALPGFFFMLICTPGLTEDTHWIPAVFGGSPPKFKSTSEQSTIEKSLKQLFWLGANDPGNLYPKAGELSDVKVSEFFQPGNPMHEWSKGFVRALNLTDPLWTKRLLKADTTDFQHTAMNLGFFINHAAAVKLAHRQDRSIDELVADIFNRFPLALEALMRIGKNTDKNSMIEFNASNLHE